jgi:hypothetical protein
MGGFDDGSLSVCVNMNPRQEKMAVINGLVRLVHDSGWNLSTPGLSERLLHAADLFALDPKTVAKYVDAVKRLLAVEAETGHRIVLAAEPSKMLTRKEPVASSQSQVP